MIQKITQDIRIIVKHFLISMTQYKLSADRLISEIILPNHIRSKHLKQHIFLRKMSETEKVFGSY